jgi:hypothetical protein
MALSAFDDKSKPFQKDELATTLGKMLGWPIDYDERTGIHEIPIEFNEFAGGSVFTLYAARK